MLERQTLLGKAAGVVAAAKLHRCFCLGGLRYLDVALWVEKCVHNMKCRRFLSVFSEIRKANDYFRWHRFVVVSLVSYYHLIYVSLWCSMTCFLVPSLTFCRSLYGPGWFVQLQKEDSLCSLDSFQSKMYLVLHDIVLRPSCQVLQSSHKSHQSWISLII